MKRFYEQAGRTATLATLALALVGCGGAPPLHQPKDLSSLEDSAYEMTVSWTADIGAGAEQQVSGLQAVVNGDRVFVAGADGRVSARELDSGDSAWTHDTEQPLIAGPALGDGVAVVATDSGDIRALAMDDGQPQWHRQFSSEVIAAPAIADGTVVTRTLDGRVVALDAKTGNRKWTVQRSEPKLTLRGTSSPVIVDDSVYVGMDSGKVLALSLTTGEKRWSQVVALPTGESELARIVDVDATPIVQDSIVYAVSVGNKLAALSRSGGTIRWHAKVSSSQGLATDRSSLYVVDSSSAVLALSTPGGRKRWQNESLEYRKLSGPAMYRGGVLVGDYQGYLHWLGSDQGDEIARGALFGAAIQATPLVADGKVLVLDTDGTLTAVKFSAAG